MMVVSPERLQSIGVKFDLAARRPLERLIRTVGRVEVDETRLAHVNIKIEGWIDELFVNYTGERVKKTNSSSPCIAPNSWRRSRNISWR